MKHSDIFRFVPNCPKSKDFEPLAFAAIGLAHSHIYCMCNGLIKAGAVLKYVYDEDLSAIKSFKEKYPQVKVCNSVDEIYEAEDIKLIASAAVPSKRAEIAIKAMNFGKDFFVDKAPLITIPQLKAVKNAVDETNAKYFVYYGESIDNEATVFARDLIKRNVIGNIFHIESLAPHRLNPESRPYWFFKKEYTGGILTDLGSHQTQQFLTFTNNSDAKVNFSRVHNYNFPEFSEFEDFGEFVLTGNNGVTGYFRMDWNSPAGLKTCGDFRMFIEGSDGYIELRKSCNIGKDMNSNVVTVVNNSGIFQENVSGKVGITYFDDLIYDCNLRTDTAMAKENVFKAIELAIMAQDLATR